ncbi:hypothetical protein BD324DRAFT_618198 [Kockovaella imperatae]|uniref:RING-type domain-containing protein n=1 Tax=Kockovaella imperatae TaxID=4999 RepID=A0A1Y1UNB1_9TREE|nr:hypothetical protein BD324DRAFT_618198 [Kockovaella imperatae]ORX39007.1 hypothetical protein BD324DRAFT_618198 [Kockovaella imperatae]
MSDRASGNRPSREPLLRAQTNLHAMPVPRPSLAPRSLTADAKKRPTRIIRTFEEVAVEVEKTVMAESWYEELECGICSSILGAPHALVPCGHSFCGACAWQWIKVNQNLTCPHCRVEVFEGTPIVPNIMVDQIIERKLRSLPEGEQKTELLAERKEKADAWKAIQREQPPAKPARRPRGFGVEDIIGFFDAPENSRRLAARHIPELGAQIPGQRRAAQLQYGGMNLGEIRRAEAEEDAMVRRMEIRRLREAMLQAQDVGVLTEEPTEIDSTAQEREQGTPRRWHRLASRAPPTPFVPDPVRRSGISSTAPSDSPTLHGRPTPVRSSVFAARQARARGSQTRESTTIGLVSDED